MQRPVVELLDLEREFQIGELFFSTTDARGVILHGNDVFTRISGYEEAELIGSPHSIIRHPDMPRTVFHLLWETIQDGRTIAAYVKNLAKDGRYYWVLAVVMPCAAGYLSVRLKPTTPLFEAAKQLYAQLLQIERTIEVDPKRRPAAIAASREKLEQVLASLGFPTYESFMLQVLSAEMTSRYEKLGKSNSLSDLSGDGELIQVYGHCKEIDVLLRQAYERLEEFKAMNVALVEKSANVLTMAESIRTLSMNATIAASKLGPRGATLQVVSESLGSVSDDSQNVTRILSEKMEGVVVVLDRLIFDLAATKLQSEVSLHFVEELLGNSQNHENGEARESLTILFEEMNRRTETVFRHLAEAEVLMSELQSQVIRLARNNKTLRFVQFAGEKESVCAAETEVFTEVFHEVRSQIISTKQECDSLARSLRDVLVNIKDLRQQRSDFIPHLQALDEFRSIAAVMP